MIRRVFVSFVCLLAAVGSARAQGRAIQAQDGDVVLLPKDATINVVRSLSGRIRVAVDATSLIVAVLIDEGPNPDGIADFAHRFQLDQPFPAQLLADGPGTIEEYESFGAHRSPRQVAVVGPAGRILFQSGPPGMHPRPGAIVPEHVAAFHVTGSSWRPSRDTLDDAQRDALAGFSGTPRIEAGVSLTRSAIPGSVSSPPPAGTPVRVGGNIRAPLKTKDVEPVMPDLARQVGIQGIVILEVTIDTQGKVANARVLRSILQLDQAALDAVRQWEYTPTYLNGSPVPVIMTVPVPFGSQAP